MTLAEQMITDVAQIFANLNEHAETVTINGKPVVAIIEARSDVIPINQFGGVQYTKNLTRLYVAEAHWPTGVPLPRSERTYDVNGKRYIADVVSLQAGLWIVDFLG
jgi:hypothetical protein